MSSFLFVSSFDFRRNTSSNIRTIALMQSLTRNGHIVDVAYVQSSGKVDIDINNAFLESCSSIFVLLSAQEKSSNDSKSLKR